MDKMQSLKAQIRTALGSGDARRARLAGALPASLQGREGNRGRGHVHDHLDREPDREYPAARRGEPVAVLT